MIQGADGNRVFAESKPKLYLSMWRKIIETPEENEGFCRFRGLTENKDSVGSGG